MHARRSVPHACENKENIGDIGSCEFWLKPKGQGRAK